MSWASDLSNLVIRSARPGGKPRARGLGLRDGYHRPLRLECLERRTLLTLSATPVATLTGLSLGGLSSPLTLACDAGGDLFVPNPGNNTASEFAPGSTTPSATLTGLNEPAAVASNGGKVYVVNCGQNTVSRFAPAPPRRRRPSRASPAIR